MDTAEVSKFSLTVDVLVAAPMRYRQLLEPLLQGADARIEGVAVKEAIRAIWAAFAQRQDWDTLGESARMEVMEKTATALRASVGEADRLAGGILSWALTNRRNGTQRRRDRLARAG
jgi:hypothetical protein